MANLEPTPEYLLFNTAQTKYPAVVVQIAGLDDILSNTAIYTAIKYGDPITYGESGLVYGGLREYSELNPVTNTLSTFRDYLSLDGSSLSIQQTIEPEQGRGSISTLRLGFIDKNGYMTNLVSPGQVLPEILGAEVTVSLGFQQLSFPDQYFQIFRGVITSVDCGPGMVTLGLSDNNVKRRGQIFYCAQTYLTSDVAATDNVINVVSNADFFAYIVGPDGSDYDTGLGQPLYHCYVQIDDEVIECTPDAMDPTKLLVYGYPSTYAGRGARGTSATTHDSIGTGGSTVNATLQIGDNNTPNPTNAMDLALQIMLSGWNGPWVSSIPILSIGPQVDPSPLVVTTNLIQMPQGVDPVATYGVSVGDWITISGSGNSSNNSGSPYQIAYFQDNPVDGTLNNYVFTSLADNVLFKEPSSLALLAFRSQYDVLPVGAGMKLSPLDVDIAQHQYVKQTFLQSQGNALQFYLTEPEDDGKSFLEQQVYLAVGAYSLTRRGLLSVGYTSPPVADQTLVYLTPDNILNPDKINIQRATNNRAFYDEVDWDFNPDDSGNIQNVQAALDSNAYTAIGILSVLPLTCNGLITLPAWTGQTVVNTGFNAALQAAITQRQTFLLARYSRGACILTLDVNWQAGSLIEAGDVVVVEDDGTILQISNFATGERGLGTQLFEVVGRTFDIKSGKVSLKLINGLGAQATDRFATISPSSLVVAGSTITAILIQDSFGAAFPGDESAKWEPYVGMTLHVHSPDFSNSSTCTLTSIDPVNNYLLHTSALGYTPSAGDIIEVDEYPTSTDPTVDEVYKILHAFLDPTLTVTSGSSTTVFHLSSGDAAKVLPGAIIRIHDVTYDTHDSGDVTVKTVSGTTITLETALTFTPAAGYQVDLVGFADGGYGYMWL